MSDRRSVSVSPARVTTNAREGLQAQVIYAASRLKQTMSSWQDVPTEAEVVVAASPDSVPGLGEEGYVIRSTSARSIEILANTDAGAANGIYGLLMAVRTRQIRKPFAEQWDVTETPRWVDRRIGIASYVMGMSKMTPDTWAFPEWKEYIDFVRQFNINRMAILGLFPYHPDLPDSHKNKWRLDAQKQAITYAHEHGLKVNVLTCYNQVPTEVFWQHPELRTSAIPGYFGLTLCWSKAKDTIMKYHNFMLEYLEGLDGIEIMVTEPLGWCLCDQCRPDTAAVWLDAVKEIGGALRANNPEGEVVFWNWLSGFFTALKGIYPPTTEIENLDEIQGQLLRDMPPDVVFFDLSKNQLTKDQEFGPRLTHPDSIEILEVAPENGFDARNFFFYMDKEFGMLDRASLFPKPYLEQTLDEFQYTKRLPVSGVSSYRLAPPGRFLSDFFFMRMAWNPNITREELVGEAAAYLTSNAQEKGSIVEAIERIEQYWHERDREDLLAARDAFDAACKDDPYQDLVRIRDGLLVLAMVDDYARLVRKIEKGLQAREDMTTLMKAREEKVLAVYQALKEYPIYQGLTTDGVWEPRAVTMLLRPRMDMWANYINHKGYYE